jgi:hypothetical protein
LKWPQVGEFGWPPRPYDCCMSPFALLPLYSGAAWVKEWGHWQTDILAAWALGGTIGYLAHERESPFILGVLPHGAMIGLKTKFCPT